MVVSIVVVGFRGFSGFRSLGHTRFPRASVREKQAGNKGRKSRGLVAGCGVG
jgi:hypothetical protein